MQGRISPDIDVSEFEHVLSETEHDLFWHKSRRIAVNKETMDELAHGLAKQQTFFSESDFEAETPTSKQFELDLATHIERSRFAHDYSYNSADFDEDEFDAEISSEPEQDPALSTAEEDADLVIPSYDEYAEDPSMHSFGLQLRQREKLPKIDKRAARIEQILIDYGVLPDKLAHFSLAELSKYRKFSASEFDKINVIFETSAKTGYMTSQLFSVLCHELMFRYKPDFFLKMLAALEPLTSDHLRTIENDRSQELFFLIDKAFANHTATDEYIRALFSAAKPEQYPELLKFLSKEIKRGSDFHHWLTPTVLQQALQSKDMTGFLLIARHNSMTLASYSDIEYDLNKSPLSGILQAFAWLHENKRDKSRIAEAFNQSETAQELISYLVKLDLLSNTEVQFHLHSTIVMFSARAAENPSIDEYQQLLALLMKMQDLSKLTPEIVSKVLSTICWQQKIVELSNLLEQFTYFDTGYPVIMSDPLLHVGLYQLLKQFDSKNLSYRYILESVDPDNLRAIHDCLYEGIHQQQYLEWLTPELFKQALCGKDHFHRIMRTTNALHEVGCLNEYVDRVMSTKSFPAAVEILQAANQLTPSKIRMIQDNHHFIAAVAVLRSYGILNTSDHHSLVMRTAEQNKVIGMLITKPKLCQRIAHYDSIAAEVNDPLLETYHENCRADLMMMLNHRFDVRFMSRQQFNGINPEQRVAKIKAALSP